MIETPEIEQRAARSMRLPPPLLPLERLSWNYWWSWAADGAGIFRDLDPDVWEECEHNPRLLLSRTSEYRLAQVATEPPYLERVQRITEAFDQYMAPAATWSKPDGVPHVTPEHPVAYF